MKQNLCIIISIAIEIGYPCDNKDLFFILLLFRPSFCQILFGFNSPYKETPAGLIEPYKQIKIWLNDRKEFTTA